MFFKRCVQLGGLAVSLMMASACSTMGTTSDSRAGGISPDPAFGESTKYNAAVHIIDPDPVYAANDSQPGDDGSKGAAAVRRYRSDQVKQVEQIQTTTGAGGGGGGGSGGLH